MKKYCSSCRKEIDAKIIGKEEYYTVFGEKITVNAHVLVCPYCGEEFFCEDLDNRTLKDVFSRIKKHYEEDRK